MNRLQGIHEEDVLCFVGLLTSQTGIDKEHGNEDKHCASIASIVAPSTSTLTLIMMMMMLKKNKLIMKQTIMVIDLLLLLLLVCSASWKRIS